MVESEYLMLTKDGLLEHYWDYDESSKKGEYKDRIIDFVSTSYLHDSKCLLDKDLLFKDVLEFINRNLEYWSVIVGNWCDLLVKEGLEKSPEKKDDVKYLECYWSPELSIWDDSSELYIPYKMDFHGVGDNEKYSVAMTPVNELVLYPIRINKKFEIIEDDFSENNSSVGNKVLFSSELQPTLFQIIYGIIWELSFYGDPSSRIEKFESLQRQIEDIKEGKGIPWGEL